MSDETSGASSPTNGTALIAEHKEITRKLRIASISFPVVLMGVIAWNLTALANEVKAVDGTAVATHFAQHANVLWPQIEEELAGVASAVQPALTMALETEAGHLAPQIEQRLQADMEKMASAAEEDFRNAVEQALIELEAQQRAVLVREIPALADDTAAQDKVLQAIHDAMSKWAVAQLSTTFDEHLDAMEDLRDTLEQGYTHDADEDADPQDALMIWLELLNEKLGGDGTIVPEAGAKKGKRS